jgi:hypothetical protein
MFFAAISDGNFVDYTHVAFSPLLWDPFFSAVSMIQCAGTALCSSQPGTSTNVVGSIGGHVQWSFNGVCT